MDYYLEKTEWGWMGLAVNKGAAAAVVLPRSSYQEVLEELEKKTRQFGRGLVKDQSCESFMSLLISFLRGEERQLDIPYSVPDWATAFQRRVWEVTCTIPYGETRSYGWVAVRAGSPKGCRAVGQALGKNPVPLVVPCHRVIASDGSLGGFTGGLERKRWLLAIEDVLRHVKGE